MKERSYDRVSVEYSAAISRKSLYTKNVLIDVSAGTLNQRRSARTLYGVSQRSAELFECLHTIARHDREAQTIDKRREAIDRALLQRNPRQDSAYG